jgi:hypothetical protein
MSIKKRTPIKIFEPRVKGDPPRASFSAKADLAEGLAANKLAEVTVSGPDDCRGARLRPDGKWVLSGVG